MITETSNKNDLLKAIEAEISALTGIMDAINEDKVNAIPYEGSWSAPQILRHVTKSINGMTISMELEAKSATRNPGEKIAQLKNAFLDFTKKMNSPEFIIPEDGPYEKQGSINEINNAFSHFKEATEKADLNGMVAGLPFGEVTKLEILHFVLYHTTRHVHQMKKNFVS